jgi:hypothetical protein
VETFLVVKLKLHLFAFRVDLPGQSDHLSAEPMTTASPIYLMSILSLEIPMFTIISVATIVLRLSGSFQSWQVAVAALEMVSKIAVSSQ